MTDWRVSSRCDSSACVQWRRSSRCDNVSCVEVRRACESNQCVEVHIGPLGVQLRDSKLGDASPILTFTEDEWREFLERVKSS